MSVDSASASRTSVDGKRSRQEAPLTLTTEPPRPLGLLDQLAMWGNLGISLFGPLTGALVLTTTGSVGLAITAIVVGCTLGALLLGASAMFGVTTGCAGDGRAARAARPSRLRRPDDPQHRAEHRLGHDGDHRHLHGRRRGHREPVALALRDSRRAPWRR